MKQVVIENPVLNSPFDEPRRHFRFTDAGITKTTARLLGYWQRPDRERQLFFCQIEALETAIYITEVAGRYGDAWIENEIRRANDDANPSLYRIAFKMATGSGKTVVMAMLVAWQALNKLANPQDARFSDACLIVTPGITIRDRLGVLLPNDPQNYYRQHDILPPELLTELGKAKIVITNFHTFRLRERMPAGRLTKSILARSDDLSRHNPFTETPDQMVRRACREWGNKKNIVVLNDEAHHCYRRKPDGEPEERLTGEERKEAEKREEEARIWIAGLEAVKSKVGIKVIYDLSATPFFLRGSGYAEGTLFPWVVSDFSLIDAIEAGIVKVPRVPVADDSMVGEQPTYRDLWLRIREHLPKKGRGTDAISGEPKLPVELEGALQSLYSNYEKYYRQWERATEVATTNARSDDFSRLTTNARGDNFSRFTTNARSDDFSRLTTNAPSDDFSRLTTNARSDNFSRLTANAPSDDFSRRTTNARGDDFSRRTTNARGDDFSRLTTNAPSDNFSRRTTNARSDDFSRLTPPVFIVVCNNTNVSKLVFDYIAGWEKTLPDGSTVLVPGKLTLFSNVADGRWLARPNTILIDSQQLESGEAMSDEFKKIAAREIEEFKADYRARFPGHDADALTDEDLLREVMNTVGKPGKLGEQVKCVVSVSMLTEGWDANTVTHILGVRAFGTQLLCEQVVGRGLRRRSYATKPDGMFEPEYAEVYGVPFSFIPSAGSAVDPKPGPTPTRVRALEDRLACEITFPRVVGYRYELPSERLTADFGEEAKLALSTADVPSRTEMSSIIGEASFHDLYGLRERHEQESDFRLAALILEKYFRDAEGSPRIWLYPQLLTIVRRWRAECLTCKDNAFPQMLLLAEFAHDAADRIYRAIVASNAGETTLRPILRPYDPIGSTRYVDFDTTRPVYPTDPLKCHISHVVADTGTWEQKMAQALEEMDEVVCYVKNHNLGFTIPYTINGEEHGYLPDYIVRVRLDPKRLGHPLGLLNLILEVSGAARKDKAAKVATARTLWVPAINSHSGFGRWAFLEISDPWDAKNTIRAALANMVVTT